MSEALVIAGAILIHAGAPGKAGDSDIAVPVFIGFCMMVFGIASYYL